MDPMAQCSKQPMRGNLEDHTTLNDKNLHNHTNDSPLEP